MKESTAYCHIELPFHTLTSCHITPGMWVPVITVPGSLPRQPSKLVGSMLGLKNHRKKLGVDNCQLGHQSNGCFEIGCFEIVIFALFQLVVFRKSF